MNKESPLRTLLLTRENIQVGIPMDFPNPHGDLNEWWRNEAKPFAYAIFSIATDLAINELIAHQEKIEPFQRFYERKKRFDTKQPITLNTLSTSPPWMHMMTYYKSLLNQSMSQVLHSMKYIHTNRPTAMSSAFAWLEYITPIIPRDEPLSISGVLQSGITTGVEAPLKLFGSIPESYFNMYNELPHPDTFEAIAHQSVSALNKIGALDLVVFNALSFPPPEYDPQPLTIASHSHLGMTISANSAHFHDVASHIPANERSPLPHGCPSIYGGGIRKMSDMMIPTATKVYVSISFDQ